MDRYQVPYTNLCIRKFAARKSLKLDDAFAYLDKYGGMKFLVDFYDIEHTLPLEDTIDELEQICIANQNRANEAISRDQYPV